MNIQSMNITKRLGVAVTAVATLVTIATSFIIPEVRIFFNLDMQPPDDTTIPKLLSSSKSLVESLTGEYYGVTGILGQTTSDSVFLLIIVAPTGDLTGTITGTFFGSEPLPIAGKVSDDRIRFAAKNIFAKYQRKVWLQVFTACTEKCECCYNVVR